MATRHPAHHYCDVYDSLQQVKNLHGVWGDAELNRFYLGRLRLDTLLAEKTIIKDAELLNGIFFLSATERPNATEPPLLNELPLDKIEIRTRARTLEESLLALFVRPGEPSLRGIFFSSASFGAGK